MRKLQEILEELPINRFRWVGKCNANIEHVYLDSRAVNPSSAFVAMMGNRTDGHQYIDVAIQQGAKLIFCENLPSTLREDVVYVQNDNLRSDLAFVAQSFYGNPSEDLFLIGVTGTNGKTTVATLFYRLMKRLGYTCGLLSTVSTHIGERRIDSKLTTPDVFSLYRFLRDMVNENCKYAMMEVSSHAIHQNRIAGLDFGAAIFTNISHDHLDYHKTFKEYLYTKKRLFDQLDSSSFAITNVDDRNGEVMVQNTKASIRTYALKTMAHFKAKILEHDFNGMHLQIDQYDFFTRLVGQFNAYNLLAIISLCDVLELNMMDVMVALSDVHTAAGRFDLVRNEGHNITAIVDYAHTPDALENVLSTIHKVNRNRGRIITVIGCGGDRDKTKRPLMAKVAINYSDQVILTSDNPRSEDPEKILDDMESGVGPADQKKILRISDRKSAIKTAISIATTNDVILVAGKGHETYQEIKGERFPFDDKQILQEFLRQ